MPIGLAVEGANRHDKKLVEPTLKAIVIARPEVTPEKPQNMCMDKGYDYPDTKELVESWGYTAHIRSRECRTSPAALAHSRTLPYDMG